MDKKDRIAIVISIIYTLACIVITMAGLKAAGFLVIMIPLVIYWGYRFINNDISFIKISK